MENKKLNFTNRKILILLALNWITMIVLTVYFIGECNVTAKQIIGTLFIGFVLQVGFISNQMKRKKV